MRAGELKEQIKIYRAIKTFNEYSATDVVLTEISKLRAKVVFGNGFRSVINDEIIYSRSVYFTVRIYTDIKNDDIIEYKKERYRILGIKYDTDNRCKEITTELINEYSK